MKPILFFDMDDTLIPTQELFNQTSQKVAEEIIKILNLTVNTQAIIQKMNEIDLENVKTMGFSPERFPTSWLQTFEWYGQFTSSLVSNTKKWDIYKMAYSLYETELAPYPLTHETLAELKMRGYVLNLLTAGTTAIQEKRIADADFAQYFDHAFIVPMKNEQVLKELLEKNRVDPGNAYMIGNSLKSDVYPALEVGMKVIHLERDTWAFDNYKVDKTREEYHVIKDVEDLLLIFK